MEAITNLEELYLLPPPRLAEPAQLPPILGGLRLSAVVDDLPDEVEPFIGGVWEGAFSDESAAVFVQRALAHLEVRRRLDGRRFEIVGACRLGEREKDEVPRVLAVGYDYDNNLAVEVVLDEETGEFVEVTTASYQPALSRAEMNRAVALALSDDRLVEASDRSLTVGVIAVEDGPDAINAGRRLVEVMIGCVDERLSRRRILVDLSSQRVLEVGSPGCRCCEEDDE